eukprot:CAMPEP_0185575038 /NCGR_PEP_ID=MMETSP0434-20130131/6341_1 /TAXON_ID=626734 ORGANISM="Favella taraikaensis, Strain Fe Narragansett Bay" /NCGR_SAMPLE_ID=MMETSP0434 /ASSEMBLY_ACC=CAM_ASM_000379 /LENGTH=186 /DNA_ID=CAMNT_0028191799 /DNA_START=295 /DNA_END=855 /DNA_ORIENTATION=-
MTPRDGDPHSLIEQVLIRHYEALGVAHSFSLSRQEAVFVEQAGHPVENDHALHVFLIGKPFKRQLIPAVLVDSRLPEGTSLAAMLEAAPELDDSCVEGVAAVAYLFVLAAGPDALFKSRLGISLAGRVVCLVCHVCLAVKRLEHGPPINEALVTLDSELGCANDRDEQSADIRQEVRQIRPRKHPR